MGTTSSIGLIALLDDVMKGMMERVLDEEGLGNDTVPSDAKEGIDVGEGEGGRGGATMDDLLSETGARDADTRAPAPAGVVEELSLLVFEGDGDGDVVDEEEAVAVPEAVDDGDGDELPVMVGVPVASGVVVGKEEVVPEGVDVPVPELDVVPEGELLGVAVVVPVLVAVGVRVRAAVLVVVGKMEPVELLLG